MELLPPTLSGMALEARDGVALAAERTARSGHAPGRDAAAAARAAIFGDALLAEIRARLQELKSVAKP